MRNNKYLFLIIISIIISLLSCTPSTGTDGSFFEIPKQPETPENNLPETIPEIPNEPGFYVNGVNKGILLFTDILDWLNENAKNGTIYGIVLDKNITINPVTFSYSGKNVFIILKGNVVGRTITVAKKGALFKIGKGVKFGMQNNMILQGITDNTSAIVEVVGGGTFIMDNGEITGNINNSGSGGVYVNTTGTFIFNGGKIYNNKAKPAYGIGGGGIGINENGIFIMTGGEVSGNSSESSGGGIRLKTDKFTITGGRIIYNTVNGVYGNGGGISIDPSNTSIKEYSVKNIEIGNNTAKYYGGGLYSDLRDTNDVITLENILIYGNTADKGGGVYHSSGILIKKATGGIIYGNDTEVSLQNKSTKGGHAVYYERFKGNYIDETKIRNSTVTEYVELNTSKLAEWE